MNASVSRVRDVLVEVIKAALISDDRESLRCREAARAALPPLAADPPEPDSVRIDGVWTLALKVAEAPEFQPAESMVNLTLPRQCPFTLDEIVDPSFDVDAAVDRIRKSASTG